MYSVFFSSKLRNEIHSSQQLLEKLDDEYHQLEYSSNDKQLLSKKKETLLATRKKYEDLEFQFMEYETRCESEIEQAEKQFQIEQKRLMDNAQQRQVGKNVFVNWMNWFSVLIECFT